MVGRPSTSPKTSSSKEFHMGIVSAVRNWLSPVAGGTPAPIDDYWYEPRGTTSGAGIKVTPDIALKASAVYACVKILAETIATLPLDMYERVEGGKILRPQHPLQDIISAQPNHWQTAVEFWEMMILHGALRGGSFAEIKPGARGAVDELHPLHPDRVITERMRDGSLRFKVSEQHKPVQRILLQEEIFRIPGMTSDGIKGLSAVDLASEAIGLGIAADQYAARIFKNNLNLGTILVHPGKLTPEGQSNLINKLMMRFAGAGNAHRPIVLQENMKVEKFGQNATEAQLLEARKWQIGEIARYWRIPLHLLGIDDQTNRSTVEEQSLNFVRYTIRPWIKRIEQAITRDLIIAPNRFVAKFNMDGLLRGDAKARALYFSKALGSGGSPAWMTPNEVRRIEGLNPIPGGDILPAPTNPGGDASEPRSINGPAVALIDSRPPEERLVSKETTAIRKSMMRCVNNADAFREWVSAFYGGHVSSVMKLLDIPKDPARAYCAHQRDSLLEADDIEALLERWEDKLADEINTTLKSHGFGAKEHDHVEV